MQDYNPFLEKVKNKQYSSFLINKATPLTHVIAIGDIGMAKSSINTRICELDYENRYKIWELYSDPVRMDNAFWCFPSEQMFWHVPKVEDGRIITKKSYPTNLLYPITKKTPTKLPMIAKPFTIPINSLDEADFAALLGQDMSDSVRQIWNQLKYKIRKETTPFDFINLMNELLYKKKEGEIKPHWFGAATLKYNIFQPLMDEGLFTSENCETSINLLEELKDKNSISVLVLRHAPKAFHGFLVHWFVNHINQLSKDNNIRTIIKFNEAPDILRKPDIGMPSASFAITNQISNILKQGRTSNLYFRLDCQEPKELPDIKNTISTVICCRTSYLNDIKEMTGVSTRSGSITQDELLCIPFLKPGEAFIFRKEDFRARWVKFIWPRHRVWKTGEEFYRIWDKLDGRWKSIKDLVKLIDIEREQSINKWKEKKALDKDRERYKKMLEKQQRREELKEIKDLMRKKDELETIDEEDEEDIKEAEIKTKKKKKARVPKEIKVLEINNKNEESLDYNDNIVKSNENESLESLQDKEKNEDIILNKEETIKKEEPKEEEKDKKKNLVPLEIDYSYEDEALNLNL